MNFSRASYSGKGLLDDLVWISHACVGGYSASSSNVMPCSDTINAVIVPCHNTTDSCIYAHAREESLDPRRVPYTDILALSLVVV